jgi:hypothetical protein
VSGCRFNKRDRFSGETRSETSYRRDLGHIPGTREGLVCRAARNCVTSCSGAVPEDALPRLCESDTGGNLLNNRQELLQASGHGRDSDCEDRKCVGARKDLRWLLGAGPFGGNISALCLAAGAVCLNTFSGAKRSLRIAGADR